MVTRPGVLTARTAILLQLTGKRSSRISPARNSMEFLLLAVGFSPTDKNIDSSV
jgi:hypothetical protein